MNTLKRFLLNQGKTQEWASRTLGISLPTVSRIANRKKPMPLLIRYALAALDAGLKPYGEE